jgi:hypothetical protein
MADTNLMTALFKNREDAENAYQELLNRGFSRDDISVLISEESRNRYYGDSAATETELGNKAAEGTGVGAAIGGTLGAVIAAIAAIGTSVALPGLGLIIAGPVAAAFAGAGAGGLTGGLVGALVGSGIPEERAVAYESGLREGGIVLGFRPRTDEEAEEVEKVWKNHNGDVSYR